MKLRLIEAAEDKYLSGIQKYGPDWGGDEPFIELHDDLLDCYVYATLAIERIDDSNKMRPNPRIQELVQTLDWAKRDIARHIDAVAAIWRDYERILR